MLDTSDVGFFHLGRAIEARFGVGERRQVNEDVTVPHYRQHPVRADVDLAEDELDVVRQAKERRVPLRGDVVDEMNGLEPGYPQVPDQVRADVAQRPRDAEIHRRESMIRLVSANPSRNR